MLLENKAISSSICTVSIYSERRFDIFTVKILQKERKAKESYRYEMLNWKPSPLPI